MANTILVIAEQREGKLNRVSWETVTAAQAIAAETGWSVEAAVFGDNIASVAAEVAGKKVSKVYAIESPKLARYTPDGTVAALKQFIQSKQPGLVLMPHTYQVRDFAPQFAADVSFACEPPHFVTFQAGAFRVDKAEFFSSSAPDEAVTSFIAGSVTG